LWLTPGTYLVCQGKLFGIFKLGGGGVTSSGQIMCGPYQGCLVSFGPSCIPFSIFFTCKDIVSLRNELHLCCILFNETYTYTSRNARRCSGRLAAEIPGAVWVGHRNCLDIVEKRNTFPGQQSLLSYPIVGALPSNTQRYSGFCKKLRNWRN
jgi:hypothetical protein